MKVTLFKRATNGKTTEWTIETNGNKYRTISGYTDGQKTTSKWTVVSGKNVGRSNETTADEQAKKDAQSLIQKKLDGGYYEDINSINTEKFFKPMLANKWEDYKDGIIYPLYSQPKLDGIRCIVTKHGMFSRHGEKIVSAPHIMNSLKDIFKEFPNTIFDGELYCDKLANDFNKICSLVKKTKPSPKDIEECAKTIQYHIYDLPSYKGSFTERFVELSAYPLPSTCVLVDTIKVDNEGEALLYYGQYVNEGYEGQMLRQDTKYENKRSKSLLKHKSFMDEEFIIKDVCEGEGNKSGMVGYMVFESNGIPFSSNVKATWDESKEMWKNRTDLIGKTATIQFFNYTPDGVPRFPYVIKVAREDYE